MGKKRRGQVDHHKCVKHTWKYIIKEMHIPMRAVNTERSKLLKNIFPNRNISKKPELKGRLQNWTPNNSHKTLPSTFHILLFFTLHSFTLVVLVPPLKLILNEGYCEHKWPIINLSFIATTINNNNKLWPLNEKFSFHFHPFP